MTTELPGAGEPGDGPLVLAARDGDREAFAQLVRRHEGWVLNMMTARLRRWDAAEEAAQEAFVRAFAALGSLKAPEAFRGWLRTIGDRVAVDMASARRPSPLEEEGRAPAAPQAPSPAEAEERRAGVARAIEALEEPYREVVLLRYDRGLSCAEIAGALGLSVAAVTMRLTRAHRALQKPLAQWGEA